MLHILGLFTWIAFLCIPPSIAQIEPTCPSTNTTCATALDLTYDIRRNSLLLGHDLSEVTANSFEDCLWSCNIVQSPQGTAPCQAVSFVSSNNTCFLKDGNATLSTLTATTGVDSAVAQAGQFTPKSVACGYNQNTIYNTSNGMQFQVNCNRDAVGYDPDLRDSSVSLSTGWHSDSLGQCIELCSHAQPLCYGVVWNADILRGWRNCYPKISNISAALSTAIYVNHVAQVILPIDSSCQTGNYTTHGQIFGKVCDNSVDGNSIGQVHAANLQNCMNICAQYTNGTQACVSVAYQPTAAGGFQNCRLHSDLSTPYYTPGWHAATLEEKTSNTSTSTPNNPGPSASSSSSATTGIKGLKSLAWIAGPVVGAVGLVLLVVVAVMWRRRRSRRNKPNMDNAGRWMYKAEMDSKKVSEISGRVFSPRELNTSPWRQELAG